MIKYITKSPTETRKLAEVLIKKFLKYNTEKAIIIALEGELGAGKTTFVKGLAKALKIKAKVKSPTFTLIKSHKLQATSYKFLYHLDCYRIKDHRDLTILGIKEILNDPKNIVIIEWSDRVKKILPKNHIKIHIDHINKNTRKICVN